MQKKKRFALLMCATMACVALVGGTMALLQYSDSDVNVMTLGDVKIEQHEYERVVEDGAWVSTSETDKYGYTPDKLKEFTQAKPLYPAVFADGAIKWDDRSNGNHQQSWAEVGAPGSNRLFDDSVKNAQDKFVFVENTGKSDAYVRTLIALEQGSVSGDEFKSVIDTNGDAIHWSWETVATDVVIKDKNGAPNTYVVACATYCGPTSNPTGILASGEVSYPSLLQVYMKSEATNEDVEALDGNGNGTYDILVLSQAVQASGFETAAEALTAGFGEANAANVAEWFRGTHIPDLSNSTLVSSADELATALAAGENVVLRNDVTLTEDTSIPVQGDVVIDLAGNTLTMTAGDNSAAAKAISVFTVANGQTLTIEGGEFVVNFGKNGTSYADGNVQNTLFNVQAGGKLVINDGTFTATMVEDGYNLVPVIIDNNGEVVINGGSFSTNAINLFRNTNGKMTINDGTFTGTTYPQDKEKYPYSVIWNQYANSELTVNGGTFTNLEVEKEAGNATIADGINLPLWKPLSER